MNEDQYQGNWTELKGNIRKSWAQLSDDEIEESKGNFEKLAGKIQQRFGESKEVVAKKLNELFERSQNSSSNRH
jgi:uncharacterized protein YjbJ (UPF0337 family)